MPSLIKLAVYLMIPHIGSSAFDLVPAGFPPIHPERALSGDGIPRSNGLTPEAS